MQTKGAAGGGLSRYSSFSFYFPNFFFPIIPRKFSLTNPFAGGCEINKGALLLPFIYYYICIQWLYIGEISKCYKHFALNVQCIICLIFEYLYFATFYCHANNKTIKFTNISQGIQIIVDTCVVNLSCYCQVNHNSPQFVFISINTCQNNQ